MDPFWQALILLLGLLSVGWTLKTAYNEGIDRIIKKLDEILAELRKHDP